MQIAMPCRIAQGTDIGISLSSCFVTRRYASVTQTKKTAPDFSETVFDLQCVGLTGFEPATT